MTRQLLKFGNGNAKLSKQIITFSLPAGHSCPYAKECFSKAHPLNGKIIDGKHCRFRCYAATEECRYPSVRNARWHNFNLIKSKKSLRGLIELIQSSLPINSELIRIHVSGDFFNEMYFVAWLNIALNNPNCIFYGYTKAIPIWIKYKKFIPSNFILTASLGGTHDHLVRKHKLKYAEVVFSEEEAINKGLEIDHDDSHAHRGIKSFALLLHGNQPAGSPAAEALNKLKKQGKGGYSRKQKFNPIPNFKVKINLIKCVIDSKKRNKNECVYNCR